MLLEVSCKRYFFDLCVEKLLLTWINLPLTMSACHVSISMSPENLSCKGARVGALIGVKIPRVFSSE